METQEKLKPFKDSCAEGSGSPPHTAQVGAGTVFPAKDTLSKKCGGGAAATALFNRSGENQDNMLLRRVRFLLCIASSVCALSSAD